MYARIFAFLIAFIMIIPFTPAENKNEINYTANEIKITFIFSTDGYGYSLPAGSNLIISRHFVLWYYENGTTVSYIPEFEVKGKQFGIGMLIFGLWKAPSILKQPGNITGMGFGIVIIFQNITIEASSQFLQ